MNHTISLRKPVQTCDPPGMPIRMNTSFTATAPHRLGLACSEKSGGITRRQRPRRNAPGTSTIGLNVQSVT
jgi:hypothetical protein